MKKKEWNCTAKYYNGTINIGTGSNDEYFFLFCFFQYHLWLLLGKGSGCNQRWQWKLPPQHAVKAANCKFLLPILSHDEVVGWITERHLIHPFLGTPSKKKQNFVQSHQYKITTLIAHLFVQLRDCFIGLSLKMLHFDLYNSSITSRVKCILMQCLWGNLNHK